MSICSKIKQKTKMSLFGKLKSGFKKTANSIASIFSSKSKLDEAFLEQLEESFIMSDLGIEATSSIMSEVRKMKIGDETSIEDVKLKVKEGMLAILEMDQSPLFNEGLADQLSQGGEKTPYVIMMCGVNGNGKTTTSGKLAKLLTGDGYSVMLAACDTFRAGAVSQLKQWSDKIGALFFSGKEKSDPASVVYDSYIEAKKKDIDFLILDTAGRMPNNNDLMNELEKCNRVLNKASGKRPDDIILVIDGTTGQNAYKQVDTFSEKIKITGIIITKIDSTAKGGAILGIYKKYQIPVYAVGVGEGADDLRPFDAESFVDAILSID